MLDVSKLENISLENFFQIQKNYVQGTPNLFLSDNVLFLAHSNKPGDYFKNLLINEKKDKFIENSFTEDFYNKGYFIHNTDFKNQFYSFTKVSNTIADFDFKNRNTYKTLILKKAIYTIDHEKLSNDYLVFNFYDAINEEIYKVYNNKEIVNEFLEKGDKSKDVYFIKEQKKYFDGMIKYRKFNNIYNKPSEKFQELSKSSFLETKKLNLQLGVESLTHKAFEGIKYTYGLELETVGGRISEEEASGLNFKTVHDGSLRGPNGEDPLGAEYVTGVLIGDSGLSQLSEICRVIGKNCTIDKRCGVHVHIGSLNWNKEEVVFAYLLGELIEKDLFSILPASRRENSYCRPLTKILTSNILERFKKTSNSLDYKILIDEAYDLIYKEVTYYGKNVPTNIITSVEINKKRNHPRGSKCGYDKNSQRYCWLNFVTLLFDTKGNANSHTIEIRNHGGTMNYKKIRNWLKISFAFCRFVEDFKSDIINKPLTLEYIVDKIFPKTGKDLKEYIVTRRDLFRVHGESIDYLESEVIKKQSIKEVAQCV